MHDIAEFLGAHDPFSGLDEAALDQLGQRVQVEFFAAGETIVEQGAPRQDKVRMVRRGAVELVDHGRVIDLLGEGEMFGHPSMLSGLPTGFQVRAEEDTLCYALAAEDAVPLLARPSGLRFLGRSILDRPRPSGGEVEVGVLDAAEQPARSLIRERPVVCNPELTVRDATRRMEEDGASAVLVRLDDGEFGILTDRDLRSRVIAGGVSPDVPVSEVMTAPAFCIGPDETGADLMLAMLDHDIHHVPVLSAGSEVLGVIRDVDLLAAQTRTPFMLRRGIEGARTVADLRKTVGQLNQMVIALQRSDLGHAQISGIISVVADSVLRRMVELAIESAGPAPVEFTWLSLGSHGRREAVPSSDIDSGMAWADGEDADAIGSYMRGIGEDVAHSLGFVGWKLDPHGVTASGAFSASSMAEWRRSVSSWLSNPGDERVLIATSILLDGRTVYGPGRELDVKGLFYENENRAKLLHWLLRLAISSKPPTGFRRDIVVEESGEHRGRFDIKSGGLLPIADLARYAGFKGGLRVTSTIERLRGAAAAGAIDETGARTLAEAWDLFAELRLEHQVGQLEAGLEPDNFVDPGTLNPLTRRYLRDAFRAVASVQKALAGELNWGS